jgi:hypothetical protein
MALWVIPGCALEGGRGWKVWLSRDGPEDFTPGQVVVTDATGQPAPFSTGWALQQPLKGLDRRIGVLTITLGDPRPGQAYRIHFPDLAQELYLRSLPDNLRAPVTFLFCSCFYRPADRKGRYLDAIRAIPVEWRPAFKLLLGDQLYCDWPPERDLPDVLARRAYETYGYRYATYWGDESYRQMMRECPNFFLGEDHEYWNDYPESSWRLVRSWPGNRERFSRAADDYYRAFQMCNNPRADRWYSFTVGPVSFFVADTRSERDVLRAPSSRLLSDAQWVDLESWGKGLRGPGVLALGQALFQSPGKKGGLTLSNFSDDYDRLWSLLARAARGGGLDGRPHDILVLAGDIHTNRFCEATNGGLTVREFISSPVSKICPDRVKPDLPPDRVTVRVDGVPQTWTVRSVMEPTLDSTVGLVRMSDGTNGSVNLELALWRIRPYPLRSRPEEILRCLGRPVPEADFQFVFTHSFAVK